jgi:hypothetical protein
MSFFESYFHPFFLLAAPQVTCHQASPLQTIYGRWIPKRPARLDNINLPMFFFLKKYVCTYTDEKEIKMIGILIDPEYTLKTCSNKDIYITRKKHVKNSVVCGCGLKITKKILKKKCQIACQKISEIKCQILKNNIKRMSLKNVLFLFIPLIYIHFKIIKATFLIFPLFPSRCVSPLLSLTGAPRGSWSCYPCAKTSGMFTLQRGDTPGKGWKMRNVMFMVGKWKKMEKVFVAFLHLEVLILYILDMF